MAGRRPSPSSRGRLAITREPPLTSNVGRLLRLQAMHGFRPEWEVTVKPLARSRSLYLGSSQCCTCLAFCGMGSHRYRLCHSRMVESTWPHIAGRRELMAWDEAHTQIAGTIGDGQCKDIWRH